ncbi:HdeD family acid-resistance protein [Rhizobium cremeum]|uniref:HdeD family acid-resistance protein n=1 Tax=Rhizobium cremeum TaxID=2813827 RepID=UPI000DDE7E12
MFDETRPVRFSELRAKWGWLVALGALTLILGGIALANLFLATVASVYYIGALMLVGGVLHLAHAFQVRGWESVLFWALSGVLYLLAGFMTFSNPLLASAILTLLIGAALIVAGLVRLWVGFGLKGAGGWGWIVLSGVVTALAGVIIAIGWPVNSLWILGLFLAIDLIVQGWSMVALGLALRR